MSSSGSCLRNTFIFFELTVSRLAWSLFFFSLSLFLPHISVTSLVSMNFNCVYRTLSAFIISRIIKCYVTIIFILLSCAWINSELLLLGITRTPTVRSSFNFAKDVMWFSSLFFSLVILSLFMELFWNLRDLLTIWWILSEHLHFILKHSNLKHLRRKKNAPALFLTFA